MKRTKKSLKFQKSVNVMQGLVDQGYEMNWPKASAVAKSMKITHELSKGRVTPGAIRASTDVLNKYRAAGKQPKAKRSS